MRFLLTNDDGIDAPGLEALAAAVAGNGSLLVIAPEEEKSGCGHAVTTRRPLRLRQAGKRRYAVDGSPADCVRVALHRFRGEFDCVLSGVNAGGNLGVDVFHSGTVAAAREAVLHGVPAVAVSHYRNRPLEARDWERASRRLRPLLERLSREPAGVGALWNINLPCLDGETQDPEVVFCEWDVSPLPLGYRDEGDQLLYAGVYQRRSRLPERDVDVCFSGRVAVTRVGLGGLVPATP